jgi:hypothetical protein
MWKGTQVRRIFDKTQRTGMRCAALLNKLDIK